MNEDIPGKYIHEKTRSHYLELKADGSYFLFQGSSGITGTYEVTGDEIAIGVGEATSRAKIQDGIITDSDGDKWIRESVEQAAPRYSKCPNCNSDVLENARFCSLCGTSLSATGDIRPAGVKTEAPVTRQPAPHRTTDGDDPLASMTWLPAVLRRDDFPWELIEAAGWFVAFVVLIIVAINKRP